MEALSCGCSTVGLSLPGRNLLGTYPFFTDDRTRYRPHNLLTVPSESCLKQLWQLVIAGFTIVSAQATVNR